MDTSETYIKMCEKAEEIHTESLSEDSYCVVMSGGQTIYEGLLSSHKYPFHSPTAVKVITLPRQDQLQEILDEPLDILLTGFYDFCGGSYYPTPSGAGFYVETVKRFTSMEQLWLAFLMSERYQKEWDGVNWISPVI